MPNSNNNGDQQDWWIDFGATHHMTMHKDWLLNYREFDEEMIFVTGDKQQWIKAHGFGSVRMICHIDGNSFIRVVHDVLFVPDTTLNLFSVLAEYEKHPNSEYKSTSNKCEFLINNEQMFVGSRTLRERLFRIECSIIRSQMDLSNASEEKVLELYHRRWGHLDRSYLCKMLKLHLDFDVEQTNAICESCELSELHKLTFGTVVKCKKPGDVMSAHLCGPMNVKSHDGEWYYLLMKDHYSHYRYVRLLKDKNKSKIAKAIESVLENRPRFSEFMSDDGPEFKNSKIRDLLVKYKVQQRFTAPGALEQENEMIMGMVRSFKRPNTSLPDSLWAEYLKSAVQILNKLGRSSIENQSPYEVWLNQNPTIKHLRIIGSKCYVHIHSKRRQQVRVGYLVGYNDENSSYRIYIPEKKDIYEYSYKYPLFDEHIMECKSSNDAGYETENFKIKGQKKGIINKGFLGDVEFMSLFQQID